MLLNHSRFKKLLLCTLLSSSLSAFAGEHSVSTKYGNINVSDSVKRVVTLSEDSLDSAVAVGIQPLGAIATRGGDGVAEYIQERANGISILGTARQNNLEAIAAQRPDLILASAQLSEDQYKILSKIAPTIVPITQGLTPDSWITVSRTYAQALNKTAQMNDIIGEIEAREKQMKALVESKLPEDKRIATVARWMPAGPLVMSPNIFAPGILAKTGFDVSDAGVVKKGRPHSSPLSLENLSNIDKNWLFLATLNSEGDNALQAAKKSPAFSRLNVVKDDHVISVNGQLWSSASGPLAAHAILDDIQKMLDSKVQ